METHFQKHNGFCACNRNKKNNLTEVWYKVTCGSCKKNGEYLMAKQESPRQKLSACGKTYDEFMKACKNDLSNVETHTKLYPKWRLSSFAKFSCGPKSNPKSELENYLKANPEDLKDYRIKPTPLKDQQGGIILDNEDELNSNHNELAGLNDEIHGIKIESMIKLLLNEYYDNMTPYELYKFGVELRNRLNGGE